MKAEFSRELTFLTRGLAILFIGSFVADQSSRVVWFMTPQNWCVAENYVQARFHGYKWKNWKPVAGSVSGRIIRDHRADDAYFEFINDPTPDSSKPPGYSDFGVWRWYGTRISETLMYMQHENPRPIDDAVNVVDSIYGFYKIPTDAPVCVEQE